MRFLFVSLSTSLTVSGAGAQTGSITGNVREASSGRSLSGAHVYVTGGAIGAATGLNGVFSIDAVPVGSHRLITTIVGFVTDTTTVSVEAGRSAHIEVFLREALVEIQEITVEFASVTGGLEGLKRLPGSGHYISGLELQRFSYSDVTRVLRTVPGVNLVDEDGYGLRPNIGLRGTGSERSSKVTIMEDGILAAPAPYTAPAAYYFPAVGRMRAVELRKGSSQIQYGPFTAGGAVNLMSSSIPDRWSGQLEFMGGDDKYRKIHAVLGSGGRNFGFLLETYMDRSDGFKVLDSGGSTGFDRKDYLGKVRVKTNPTAPVFQSLTLKLGRTTETSNETYLGLTDSDFRLDHLRRYSATQEDLMKSTHELVQLSHIMRPAPWIDVTTTAYRSDFSRNWYKLDAVRANEGEGAIAIGEVLEDPERYADNYDILTGEVGRIAGVLDVKANNRTYYSRGVQIMAAVRVDPGADLHGLQFGLRLHNDEVDRFQWIDSYGIDRGQMFLSAAGAPGSESNRVDGATAFAGFIRYQGKFGRWVVSPGLRVERMKLTRADYGTSDPDRDGSDLASRSNTVQVLIPGVGVDYELIPDVHAFAGVHRGFSPPGSTMGAEPEVAINYELGGRLMRRFGRAEAVFFFNDYDNLLGADLQASGGSGSHDVFNGGAVHVFGLELAGEYELGRLTRTGHSIPVRFAYTFTSGIFQNSFDSDFAPWGAVQMGDKLPYLARHQMFWGFGFESRRLGANVSVTYVSTMRTRAGTGSIPTAESTDAHMVMDVAGSFLVSANVTISASLLNATDATYVAARRPAGVRPGLPRRFRVGVRSRF